MLLAGGILFAMGLVIGVAIGSATAVSALTQGGPDVLQSWSGVVAMPCSSSDQRERTGVVQCSRVVVVFIGATQFQIEKERR